MTAWQYFAGAGLVAALCPLHGHVAVAGDGHGRGARVDLCVPAGSRPRPSVPPLLLPPSAPAPAVRPTARVLLPGPAAPTVRHPGGAARPVPLAVVAEPGPGPMAQARPPVAQPRRPRRRRPGSRRPPGGAVAPHRVAAGAGAAGRFHVRPYHSAALARRGPDGMSTLMLMVVVTTPAVLAAVALRPRSRSRG
ncbi:hypothetical protein M8Z33_25400 [Streptomyces sp. ZAF1911]|uniref:hypothetical protein n=1 Tax=Streptomyces sp. ZAF1911 TaxID=2944129 RepID=UPI00237C18D4|nr:hypothetical protein [Streptomyces sp. ZAF1911]MDD9379935.1 hypothetical protein [Streptomyces sp. ZAF1911]